MRLSKSPTLQTLAVVLAVFAVQAAGAVAAGLDLSLFALALPLTSHPWTVVTATYAHASVGHLLANAVALLIFGLLVERMTTAPRYHAFFVVSGLLAALAETFAGVAFGNPVAVVGASGAIFALMGYALAGNSASVSLLDSVDVSRKVTVGLAVAVAAGITLYTASSGAALIAHFAGLLMGLAAGRFRLIHT